MFYNINLQNFFLSFSFFWFSLCCRWRKHGR